MEKLRINLYISDSFFSSPVENFIKIVIKNKFSKSVLDKIMSVKSPEKNNKVKKTKNFCTTAKLNSCLIMTNEKKKTAGNFYRI